MTYFFGDGFDLYSQPSDGVAGGTHWDGSSANPNNSTLIAGRFSGSRALNINPSTLLYGVSGQNDAVHHFTIGYMFNAAPGGTGGGFFIQLFDGASTQCAIVFTGNDIQIRTYYGGATLATYTGAVPAGTTWYAFEFEVVIHNTNGSFTVRKNGNTSNDFFAGSLNTRNGSSNNYANKIALGSVAEVASCVDDFLWRSGSSVTWSGDIRCYTRMPVSDVQAQWTKPSTFTQPTFAGSPTSVSFTAGNSYYMQLVSQGGIIAGATLQLSANYTGNIKCAIFANNIVNNQPGTLIQSAAATIANPTTGNSTFTFSPPVSVAVGTAFWIAICVDSNSSGNCWVAASGGSAVVNSSAQKSTSVSYASFPASNPTISNFNVVNGALYPVVTATANFNAVCDQFEDGLSSYNSSATVGQNDLYGIASITNTPSLILGVVTRGSLQKSDAGTRNCSVQLKSGTTTVQSTSTALNTTFNWFKRTDLVDPNTGAAWTAAGVNSVQIGPVVTA